MSIKTADDRPSLSRTAPRVQRLAVASMVIGAMVAFAFPLSGCNTTEGAGKDIKSLGKGIEEAADDAKD